MESTDNITDKQPGSGEIGTENILVASLPIVLSRRLSKAHLFLVAVGELAGYQPLSPEESLTDCLAIVRQIHESNQQCHQLWVELREMAQLRQAYYEGDSSSLKGVANELWKYIFRHYRERTLTYELIRVISIRIRAQHPLPLPEDVFNANTHRMEIYQGSYKALYELYAILVGTLQVIRFETTERQLDYHHLWTRLEEAQTVDAQTETLLGQLIVVHQHRLTLFDELVGRTRSILRRVELQYGADHVLFRRMFRYKLH